MTSLLFRPIRLRGLELPNRIVVAPMCQYSAVDGCATDWHTIHYGGLSLSNAGLMLFEATAVAPDGRISRECLGLYDDKNEAAFSSLLTSIRHHSHIPIGVQLGHAGRKASILASWEGRGMAPLDQGGWVGWGPSAVSFSDTFRIPQQINRNKMIAIVDDFVQATGRCLRIGVDAIELHAAHGYLMSSFLSSIANQRDDNYGGNLANRMRFPLEIFRAVRAAWPSEKPLGVRLNGTDWDTRGISPDEAVSFAKELAREGCDFFDVSSGGQVQTDIPIGPGYQVPLAMRIKIETGIPTMAVGHIREPLQAETILASGQADMVALARGFLNDPRWPWHAAEELGDAIKGVNVHYRRALTRAGLPGPLENLSTARR